ncbi:hypothetical protein chiPu_0024183 [Chiloscyllium punctatum]|uniref:Reverse transcriptase domain-containing protein n=1 Tax=Chiloscyllium punctatum TaxID=137246 RepID=A0A401TC91_CHIPU|nr:hypothetical protein [Chiloscyllium punctatum]
MLFADDVAVATYKHQQLQLLTDRLSHACKNFGLSISLKKTSVLRQDTEGPQVINFDDLELNVIHQFTYPGCTIVKI